MTQDPPQFDGTGPYPPHAPVFSFNDAPTIPSGVPVGTATPESPSEVPPSGKMGRRALLAAGGLGLVAAGAVFATPIAVQKTEDAAKQQAEQAVAQARQDLLNELRTLETEAGVVGIQAAIDAAGATLWVTQNIFVPLAGLLSSIGGDALGVVNGLLGEAINVLPIVSFGHLNVGPLRSLSATLQSWRTNLQALPTVLKQDATANVTGAELYLTALQKKLEAAAQTPTATPTK